MIERLQAVYAIEAEIRGSSAEQRLAARRTRTARLMAALKTRLTATVGQLFSQSKLAEAINYALNHWEGLTLFLCDGRVEVDRNTVERKTQLVVQRQRRRRRELGDPGIAREDSKAPGARSAGLPVRRAGADRFRANQEPSAARAAGLELEGGPPGHRTGRRMSPRRQKASPSIRQPPQLAGDLARPARPRRSHWS